MSTRTSSAGLALLAAACGPGATGASADQDGLIECAVGGASGFTRSCRAEWVPSVEAAALTVRHPDGSFRRLAVRDDGRGIETADGADRATVAVTDAWTEIRVAGDRYRLPGRLVFNERR